MTVLPVTSTLIAAPLFRITLRANAKNGLRKTLQVMVDKPLTVKRVRVGQAFGRIDADSIVKVDRSLAVFLGIAK